MDVDERLTLEAAHASTVIACEHRHRYEFAARLCAGQRVLDLCCGSGYGTAILAAQARNAFGVDNESAVIDTAAATLGRHVERLSFEAADAHEFLRHDIAADFDVVVCFEGLEHLHGLVGALDLLREHAHAGLKVIASVPNGKLFEEENRFHVTQFGYDEAVHAFAGFPNLVMLPQFLAEGSLICPPGATAAEIAVVLDDRDELEYANHFLVVSGFDPAQVLQAHSGSMQVSVSPVYNRWAEGMRRTLWALEAENARLARRQFADHTIPRVPLPLHPAAEAPDGPPFVPRAQGAREIVDLFDADDPWQMSFGERTALVGLLHCLTPELSIEVGTARGGSLRHIAASSTSVHSFDLHEADAATVRGLDNVTFHIGDSHVLLTPVLEELASEGRNVDFVLVDGDHTGDGVARDLEDLLCSDAVRRTVIVAHDSFNGAVRDGLQRVDFDRWDKVVHVELDWLPGHVYREPLAGESWGGFALIVVNAQRPRPTGRSCHQGMYAPSTGS